MPGIGRALDFSQPDHWTLLITLARFNRTISVLPVESSVWAISAGILFDTPTAPGWTQSARR